VSDRPRTTNDGLVRLESECPRCHKREARRVAAWRVDLYRDVDPEALCDTVICKCGHEYTIKASAYQGAA
jgi:hypothetical protein